MLPLPRLPVILACLMFTAPAWAAPSRAYMCTNIMGGNPFRLTISEAGTYGATSEPQSSQLFNGVGRLKLAEIGSYYEVTSGPLLNDLEIDTIHIMSAGRLTPSGANGLYECTKAK